MIVALDCCFIVNLHVDYPCSKAKPNVVKERSFNLASIIVRYCDTSFPCGSPGKESACNVGNLGSVPELGRSPGGGHGNPLQYYWASLVAQMVKNLSTMQETWVRSLLQEDLPKEGRAFLLGESPGQRSLVGYSPWGHEESDMTEQLSTAQHNFNKNKKAVQLNW